MLFFSDFQGGFPVGATTFVTPVRPARIVGSAKLRNSKSEPPEPAFYLEEVAFTAYYPADLSSRTTRKGLHWLIRPIKDSLHGFARFLSLPSWLLWPVVYLYGALLKIPVHPNAPLLSPTKARSADSRWDSPIVQWPLVVFSHGLGGSRTTYSQLCSRLAASGKVVLAMGHRDGTAAACTPRSWRSDAGGKIDTRPVLYYRDDDIMWEDYNKPGDDLERPLPLRADQLAFRQQEIYTAYRAFSRMIENDRTLELETIDEYEIDKQSWSHLDTNSGKAPVCCTEDLTLAGHSFGGCTVLSIISTDPPPGHAPMPVTNALVLDPWLEPLPLPGPFPICPGPIVESVPKSATCSLDLDKSNIRNQLDTCLPRVMVLNSETFTLWRNHYERLQDVVRGWEPHAPRIITLIGSRHESFSDFLILPLFTRNGARTLMDVISKLSIAFLDGRLEEVLELIPRRKMDAEIVGKKKNKYGRPKRRLVGSVGEIIVT